MAGVGVIGDKASLKQIAPIFPVKDIGESAAHYRTLGFEVIRFDGAPYAFCRRGSVEIQLTEVSRPSVKPKKNLSAAYVVVDDADALFAEWSLSGAGGRDIRPTDTDYGMREGAHADHDNNLIRYGSQIA